MVVDVVVGGGGCVTMVVGWLAGVGACVGVVTFDPPLELDGEPGPEPEPDVVDVTGRVVEALGAVVVVAAAPAVTLAGMPLFSTANHTLPMFCPLACPFFLSPRSGTAGACGT